MKPVLFPIVMLGFLTIGCGTKECSMKKVNKFLNCLWNKIEQLGHKWTAEYVKAFEKDVFT